VNRRSTLCAWLLRSWDIRLRTHSWTPETVLQALAETVGAEPRALEEGGPDTGPKDEADWNTKWSCVVVPVLPLKDDVGVLQRAAHEQTFAIRGPACVAPPDFRGEKQIAKDSGVQQVLIW
jgi:hypothetical protein